MIKDFEDFRKQVGEFLKSNPDSHKAWDLMTGLRGPDSPSERADMTPEESEKAYLARRKRKALTGEVIRYHAFGGVVGGSARYRADRDFVMVPPASKQDHYDRHVIKAAQVLGLDIRTEEEENVGVEAKPGVKVKKEKVGGKVVKYDSMSGMAWITIPSEPLPTFKWTPWQAPEEQPNEKE